MKGGVKTLETYNLKIEVAGYIFKCVLKSIITTEDEIMKIASNIFKECINDEIKINKYLDFVQLNQK